MSDDRIIDGNHRALAAYLTKRPINYIDLSELNDEQPVAEGFFDRFRKKQQNYGGIDVSVEKEDNNILVKATAHGRELGRVLFTPSEQDDNLLVPLDLEVDERYRGQGIGATMYDYVKSLGYTIRRSQYQTDAGAGFWDKHKSGKNVWEQGVAEDNASPTKISFKVKKGRGRFATEMIVNGQQAGVYQYDANTGRSIAEVFPEFRSQGLGKILVLHAIYTAAKLGLDFQEDESRTAAYDNVLDSLSSNGYIVDDDGYWYVTGEGEQYLQQALKNKAQTVAEDTGANIPPVLYHATYKQRLRSIQLKGLGAAGKRNWTDSKRGVVYLALDPNVAESYAETALDDLDADWDIVILKISTSGLDTTKFQLDRNVLDNEGDTLEYHGIIPPGNISLYKQGVTEGNK
jgi:GNAT superfamily N-acetyltransferase